LVRGETRYYARSAGDCQDESGIKKSITKIAVYSTIIIVCCHGHPSSFGDFHIIFRYPFRRENSGAIPASVD
jgi:hypothetical protein